MLLVYVTSKASAEQELIFLNWNLESESFLRVMVNTVVTDRTNKHSDRCVDDYHSQRINSFLSIFTMYFTVKSLYLFLRASLCKILISSFAHKMDFAHNFSVDFF